MLDNSSTSTTARTLAESDLLRALRELANLRDDAEAFERFCKRWPELAYLPEEDPPMGPDQLPPKFWIMCERRDDLQRIWLGDSSLLRSLLLPVDPPEELQDTGVYMDRNTPDGWMLGGRTWEAPIKLDWQRGQFIYEPRTEFQRALYCLFLQSTRAKRCANSDCPAPYFMAQKTTQRYCTDKCAEVFQKEWKRKWWTEHGDAWRRARRKTKRRVKGKRR
jgi:hypothetical protein